MKNPDDGSKPEVAPARSNGERPLQAFTRALLDDLQALERMLESNMLESDVRRIGAEQELFLIDHRMGPAMTSLQVLEKLAHPQVTTELGLFNLEINLTPLSFTGDCLHRLEHEARQLVSKVKRAARGVGSRVLLAGILPTLKQKHLGLDAMTPLPRYHELNRANVEHRGGEFRVQIEGRDSLDTSHDNVMFEACNTSFQLHLQVGASEFAQLYNLAQAVTAPVLAAAANSPVFLQHRLWNETRLALFQQSVDSRSDVQRSRQARPRVVFGDQWVKESILEIYRQDIARFRVFLPESNAPSSLDQLAAGEIPGLAALCRHNGTVYRWNRPCYGITDGVPHLRIEHRVLPAGPTIVDEVANAALFFGLMVALPGEYGDITERLSFDDAKNNFTRAARYGLEARLQWVDGQGHLADQLLLEHLVPLARQGLRAQAVRSNDIDRYLGILEERVRRGQTGSQWAFSSLAGMTEERKREERYLALTASMYENFLAGHPVHEWQLARLPDDHDLARSCRVVEQVMTTDLYTVRPDDLVDLAASLMDWEHIRHVPVEDAHGQLVGLVSHRQLVRLISRGQSPGSEPLAVRDIMALNPLSVHPDTSSLEAIELMRRHRVSCLPVVDSDNKLVGIVTERDFIHVTAKLLHRLLDEVGDDLVEEPG